MKNIILRLQSKLKKDISDGQEFINTVNAVEYVNIDKPVEFVNTDSAVECLNIDKPVELGYKQSFHWPKAQAIT